MLRSGGFFQLVPCPFWREPGDCQRPHCQLAHQLPVGPSEVPVHGVPGPPAEGLGKNIQELERLNKAIEAVKNEVEEKQKKLMLFKNVNQTPLDCPLMQCESTRDMSTDLNDNENATILKNALTATISPKKKFCSLRNTKYVVDRRCPATDLEYDPLLNYSASLFGSSAKEGEKPKPKRLKCEEKPEGSPQKKPRAVSPIRLEIKLQESDDDVLVIDAPPLPAATKKQRAKRFHHIEPKTVASFSEVPDVVAADTAVRCIEVGNINSASTLQSVEICEIPAVPVECLADSNIGVGEIGLKNECLILDVTENMQPVLPERDAQTAVKSYCPLNYTHLGQPKSEEPIEILAYDVEATDLLLPEDPFNEIIPVCKQENLEERYFPVQSDVTGSKVCEVTSELMTPPRKCESQDRSLDKADDVIVLNSSETEPSEEDSVDSDSDDPMAECLRIFNEFESEANKEAKQVKASGRILVPFRGPAPTQISHARILHVQQQAVQISSDVKNGQAFVASAQKKVSGCLTPAFHNFGPMVCVNLVEVPTLVPCRSTFNGFYQGGALATTLRSNVPQKRTLQTTPMKITTRRKSAVVQETSSKVPHETRQRYVNSFVEEFLKESATVQEAFDKALNEEKSIYERCGSKNMYVNIAINSLKKLRDQRNIPNGSTQSGNKDSTQKRREDKYDFTGVNLYNLLKDYLLSSEQLQENGFPQPNLDKPGSALLHNGGTKSTGSDALRRVCCRCGKIYSVTLHGKHTRKEECTYHSGKVLRHRVPGGIETRYSCCEAVVGAPGCQMAKLHVHDGQKENLDGFLKTFAKLQPSDGNPGVYAVDCEMCYTTHGLELTRVTVVDPSLQVAYDAFVKPDNEIIDYNTRFSGVTEENLANITTSIRDVQAVMLNLFSADTILIGHSLENDLIALKLFHDTVVDTSIVFPHRLGLPHKRALRNLMADYLLRIIQDNSKALLNLYYHCLFCKTKCPVIQFGLYNRHRTKVVFLVLLKYCMCFIDYSMVFDCIKPDDKLWMTLQELNANTRDPAKNNPLTTRVFVLTVAPLRGL
uniref:C3H1-type domain-containing protein n=1 Tax=Leptobrachium leishanense TaxID=445787 RepID=A0A8C5LKA0_9ANUR